MVLVCNDFVTVLGQRYDNWFRGGTHCRIPLIMNGLLNLFIEI